MEISFHRSFKKDYNKPPKRSRHQFDERLIVFISDAFNPILNNHTLRGSIENAEVLIFWRPRIKKFIYFYSNIFV